MGDDSVYTEFLSGYTDFLSTLSAGAITSLADVDDSLERVLTYFRGDVKQLTVHFSRFLDTRRALWAKGAAQPAPAAAGNEEMKIQVQPPDGQQKAVENQSSDLVTMQALRRRSSGMVLLGNLKGNDGRKMSTVEKEGKVVEAAVQLAALEDQEDKAAGLDLEVVEDDAQRLQKQFNFLPYRPVPNDPIDLALADQLNIFELDVDIKRSSVPKKKGAKSHKAIYRIQGRRVYVRYIHGVLLFKDEPKGDQGGDHLAPQWRDDKTGWTPLIPALRELTGKGRTDDPLLAPPKKDPSAPKQKTKF